MKLLKSRIIYFLTIMLFSSPLVRGQMTDPSGEYIPQVGQKGKDVVWVPTPYELIRAMFSLAGVDHNDYVVDLGSGDGRVVISAAKLGARSVGVEYDHNLYELSLRNAKSEGVTGKAQFVEGDLFGFDLSDATVITLFLLPDLNKKLKPKLLNLKPGTRIVSNTFAMGDWIPDKEIETEENPNGWNTAFLWIVPGRIQGTWRLGNDLLSIRQSYQVIHGSLISGDQSYPISEGKITGNSVSFRIGKFIYNGTLGDSLMSGTRRSDTENSGWEAKRTGA